MNFVWWQLLLVIVISYFFGNVTFARIIAKSKHKDITKLGSGNPGSTNTLRNFGLKLGILNLVLDLLKGFIPSLVAFYLFGQNYVYLYIAGISTIVGHIYPVIYKFKGGKGIATMMGVFLAANPIATLSMIVVAALVWLCFQYGSVASFLCVTVLTCVESVLHRDLPFEQYQAICLLLFAIFLLTWWAHRKNIERLLLGNESKVSLTKRTKKNIKRMRKLNTQAVPQAGAEKTEKTEQVLEKPNTTILKSKSKTDA